jgi:hypothetical protein
MHSPRSLIYGKTLARCTRAVYPPGFLRTATRLWASVFVLPFVRSYVHGKQRFLRCIAPEARSTVKL